MARIRWSVEAADDLAGIHAHIARDSPQYAAATAGRIVAAVDGLAEFPESGRVVPELGDLVVRELSQGAYRIVYEVRPDGWVEVLTVFHGARRFPDLGR